jgi:hypothetical protein
MSGTKRVVRSHLTFWCLLVATAAIALGFVASYFNPGPSRLIGTDWTWKLQKGGVVVQTGLPSSVIRVEPAGPSWVFIWPSPTLKVAWISVGAQMASIYVLPLWLPLLLCGAGTGLTWRWRVVTAGGCAGCGYDLRGIASRCPECGRTVLKFIARLLGRGLRIKPLAPSL